MAKPRKYVKTLTPAEKRHRIETIESGRENGLSWAEIAKSLGTNKEALSSWWMRANRTDRDPRTKRDCMCCKVPFPSDGIHNRLCQRCKTERVPSPWETVVGTSRQVGKS